MTASTSTLVCRPCAVSPPPSFGKLLPWQCLVHSMQSSTPSVRTSLPTPMLSTHTHLLPVHFDRALSFSAIAPVRSTSTVCGFPATQIARVRLYGPLRPYTEF